MSKEIIRANKIHQILISELKTRNNIEDKILVIEGLLKWNINIHTGRYTSELLENEISNLGSGLNISKVDVVHKNKILHVGTMFYDTGGHTRLFEKYVKHLSSFKHDLLMTEQDLDTIPNRTRQMIGHEINEFISLELKDSILEKALKLAQVSSAYEHVFFHIHQHDFLPIISNRINKFNNVIFVNHADHTFWACASIVDVCLNIRPFAEKLCEKRRNIQNNYVFPIPIESRKSASAGKLQARKKLNIKQNSIVFLTISSTYKLIPFEYHSYLNTMTKLVNSNVNFEVYLIGVPEIDRIKIGFTQKHARIHILPPVEDLTDYQIASDIYLEGFPYNSLTALLESISLGCCPLLMYDPQNPYINMETELAFAGVLKHSVSESAYLKNANQLAVNPDLREQISAKLIRNLNYYNGGGYWKENTCKIFNHNEKTIRNNNFENDEFQLSENDITLNAFNLNNNKGVTGNLIQLCVDMNTIKSFSFKNKLNIIFKAMHYQRGKYKFARFLMFSYRIIFKYKT